METTKENELLQLALEALRNNLPGQAEVKAVKPVRDPRFHADFLLRIEELNRCAVDLAHLRF
jgi:hypothetical protein